jgi:hypothetical protein
MPETIQDRDVRNDYADLDCEFELRKKDPPRSLVKDDLETLQASLKTLLGSLTAEQIDEFNDRVEEDYPDVQG